MGKGFLIDTNIVIYTLGNQLSPDAASFIRTIHPAISVITQIELLGWRGLTERDVIPLQYFVSHAVIYSMDGSVVQQTIELRRKYKIKIPDAIIAATALVHGLDLVTRNVQDFRAIADLKVVNPFDLPVPGQYEID